MKRSLILVGCLSLLVSIQGCLIATKETVIAPEIRTLFKGTYKVDPFIEKAKPQTVAVLPFLNRAESKQGQEEVRRGFYNHFSSLPFRDMEIHRVDNLLRKAGIADPEAIARTPATELGKILGVDAVVYGEITDFDKLFAVVYSAVSVGAEIKMYDTKTGNFLWSGKHVSRIHEGGISTSPIGIIATIIATAMNIRDIQLLRACDDLFRDMVKTIPVPTLAEALRPPAITLLTQDTQMRPRKAGDEIRVVIQGAPRMQASFDIGEYRRNIEMVEVEPGGYLGVYKVLPGDNVTRAMITGYLRDDRGNTGVWVDAVGSVTLDTIPPAGVQRQKAVGRDGINILSWEKSAASDLAGYRIYRSLTPLTGFVEILATEFNEYRDQDLTNRRKYYYQITALDLAGNESERSETLMSMPVAPGPTEVSGVIEADTTWYAGASPYILKGDVRVKDRATLTIEAGTTILSRGGALLVEGSLDARGDEQTLILFDAVEGTRWPGIRFLNVRERENRLKHCRVRKAEVGVFCEASSPVIEACEFAGNDTAIKVSGSFSEPKILRNTIHKSSQPAVVVVDGSRPLIEGNTIQDNDREGLLIEAAAPVITKNAITRNRASGIAASKSQAVITGNNISENRPYNIVGDVDNALNNWWGSIKGLDILSTIRGRINIKSILTAPFQVGKTLELPIAPGDLAGMIQNDLYLIMANSPYRVKRDVTIDRGATVYIEPGVTVLYDQNTSITVEDGGIVASGTRDYPVVFTASEAAPSPGFYASAIRFKGRDTKVNSSLKYSVFKYAEVALDIHYGAPEISFSHVTQNSQNGIFCRNDAAPRISFNTIENNRGEGGIKAVGISRPVINNNNFLNNEIAHIQAFSTIRINAQNNWWGSARPDERYIFKNNDDSINVSPWLGSPEGRAFLERR